MERLKSDRSFIITALGAVMGLGNALRFPGLCARHGGGAFMLAYAVALATVCLPLLCSELALGKSARRPFPEIFKSLSPAGGAAGWAACANSAFVGFYYSAIIGWLAVTAFGALPSALGGEKFSALAFDLMKGDGEGAHFSFIVYLFIALGWGALFFVLKGGASTLSKSAKLTVGFPLITMLLMAGRGLLFDNSGLALARLFTPDMGRLASVNLWADAFSQALLSLSLAAGVMPAFGGVIPEKCGVFKSALIIILANFLGCILSSVALFTCLYGCGMEGEIGAAGIQTAFIVYPAAIAKMCVSPVISGIVGGVFYLSLLFVAVQSALSLLSALVVPLSERFNLTRKGAAGMVCLTGAALSLPFASFYGVTLLTACDYIACLIFALPIAAAECLIIARRGDIDGLHRCICEGGGRLKYPRPLFSFQIKFLCAAAFLALALFSVTASVCRCFII